MVRNIIWKTFIYSLVAPPVPAKGKLSFPLRVGSASDDKGFRWPQNLFERFHATCFSIKGLISQKFPSGCCAELNQFYFFMNASKSSKTKQPRSLATPNYCTPRLTINNTKSWSRRIFSPVTTGHTTYVWHIPQLEILALGGRGVQAARIHTQRRMVKG